LFGRHDNEIYMYVILKILDFMSKDKSFHPKLEESGPENITIKETSSPR